MLFKSTLIAGIIITLMVLPCLAGSVEGLPLHVKKITDNVIRIWAGDYISSTAVSAIATKKGIVVIDSTDNPKLDQAFRKVIEKELGRNDFKYLINTHGHGDHTNGNGVYADCEIIAHESAAEMMKENFSDIPRAIEWLNRDIQRLNDEIASGKLNDEQKAAANERLIIDTLAVEFWQSSPKPVFPTRTFRDKLVLDCGDTTLELYQAGGTHTQSDIFILVPQKGVLFTGDMMADRWLTDTPGCLATFAVRSGSVADYPVLLKNWQALIDRKNEITHYIPGHWNGELTFEGFQNRFNYVNAVLTDVKALTDAGGNLNRFVADYSLKNKFPHLVDNPGFTVRGHLMSIYHLYTIYSGKVSVTAALERLVIENTFTAGFDKLKEDILKAKDRYFYVEADINSFAYFLLQQRKQIDDAIKLFEFNVELHPASWNVYDSLAEAYYVKGDKEKALGLYKKSLELNPQNENGKKFIAQIEKEIK
jgi:glyoxylase-like metal-dependent hydrolase (beta-lactamase superfamily II)